MLSAEQTVNIEQTNKKTQWQSVYKGIFICVFTTAAAAVCFYRIIVLSHWRPRQCDNTTTRDSVHLSHYRVMALSGVTI